MPNPTVRSRSTALAVLALGAIAAALCIIYIAAQHVLAAGPLTPGNLVVLRLGDGTGALSSAASAVFLDEKTTAGTAVQSLGLPTAVSGSNRILTESGSATSEGALNRS